MKLKLSKEDNINNEIKKDDIKTNCDIAKEEISATLIDGIEKGSIDIQMSEEESKKSRKRHKNLKIKRTILYITLILFFISIMIFGFVKTFLQHTPGISEIAPKVNRFNEITNFPNDGVPTYLNDNMDKLLKEKLTVNQNISKYEVANVSVTRINHKTNEIANVYFFVDTITNVSTVRLNCILPLGYDKKLKIYSPLGDVIITPNTPSNISTKKQKNILLSFEGIAKENDKNTENAKVFMHNFFKMLYSGENVTPYYKGKNEINSKDIEYINISDFILYTEPNKNGYNAYTTINLTMSNGISYKTEKYFNIEKQEDAESWKILSLL